MKTGFQSGAANWETPNARGVYAGLELVAGAAAGSGHCRAIGVHQQAAANPLVPCAIPPTGPAPVGTFAWAGRGQAAAFKQITLARYNVEITRRYRRQVVECHYPVTPDGFRQLPIAFKNADGVELAKTALGDSYTFGIAAYPEHLLGFEMDVTPTGSPVYWFSKLANAKNPLCAQLAAMINAQAGNIDQHFPPLNIRFAQGNLTVTPQNLVRAYAFFAYGEALQWRLPTMQDLVQAVADGAEGVADLTRVTVPGPTDEQRIRYEYDPTYLPGVHTYGVETLALVLAPGSPVLPAC